MEDTKMTTMYEKLMGKYAGIEFDRENGVLVGCHNAIMVRCTSCDWEECPAREVA
jgi:hypothetical protein